MFTSRGISIRGAPTGAPRGRRSRRERLRRLLERRRFERFQHLPHGEGALGELARDALDAQLVRRGELPAILLYELQHCGRVEGRVLHELQLDEFGGRIDARDADGTPEDTQAVALDQRARRARQIAEADDQFYI